MIISLIPMMPASAEMPELPIQNSGNAFALGDIVPDEVLVKFKASSGAVEIAETHKRIGGRKMNEIKSLKIQQVKLAKGLKVDKAIEMYNNMPAVEFAEPNRYRHIMLTPNDTYYQNQWALPRIKAPQAWDIATGGEVVVAVIDTGVDYNHTDLSGRIIKGYDFINNDSDPMDDHWHGTHVAGVVAAATDNGKGVAAISWGAKILAIKAMDNNGSGTDVTVANGIKYAADNGAKVINLSLGGGGYSSTLANAVSYAQGRGCIVVAAAGNSNSNTTSYPAGYQNVIGVAATDSSDNKASFSNYGWYVDVAAPGVSILSCYKGGYAYASGTSMATPHVAGLAAFIASKYPGRDANQLLRSIYGAVDDIGAAGRDNYFGHGRIDMEKGAKTFIVSDEENSPKATYSGSWSNSSASNASGGTFRHSSSAGATVTYPFNGTGISWIARKATAAGIARVYIDGTYQRDVDLYGTLDYQQPIYAKTGLSAGDHTITIEVKGARNTSSSGTEVNVDAFDVVTVEDIVPPAVSATDPADGATGITGDKAVSVTFNETIQAGASYEDITIRDANGNPVAAVKSISSATLSLAPANNLAGGMQYMVTIPAGSVQDMAGNSPANDYGFRFTTAQQSQADITPPTGSIQINNNDPYTGSTSVTLNISATDMESGVHQMMISGSPDFSGANWMAYATSVPATFSAGDGTRTVYIKFMDHAGNISLAYSDSIFLDTRAPAGKILINNNRTYTYSSSVTLNISASDPSPASGMHQMMISNRSDFSGAVWVPYATSVSWTLTSGTGTKVVYIRFMDRAGNISSTYSDSIIRR